MSDVAGPDASAADIVARFDNELRAARGHERFTANSFLDLWAQVQHAANEMVRQGRTHPSDIDDALTNFRLLLDQMETERASLGYTEYREDTVYRALNALCPGFWPFC